MLDRLVIGAPGWLWPAVGVALALLVVVLWVYTRRPARGWRTLTGRLAQGARSVGAGDLFVGTALSRRATEAAGQRRRSASRQQSEHANQIAERCESYRATGIETQN